MTKKQRSYQIALLRQLHTAPRYTEYYSDDPIAYRAFLKKHLSVDSSKDLPLSTLKELVEYMQMRRDTPPSLRASAQQIGFIRHLWSHHAAHPDEQSLLSFASRVVKREISDIYELRPDEASALIAGIKKLRPNQRKSGQTFANNIGYKPNKEV